MSQFEINDSVIYDLGAAMAAEEPRDTYISLVDSAVHQLGSAQDVAYTNKHFSLHLLIIIYILYLYTLRIKIVHFNSSLV